MSVPESYRLLENEEYRDWFERAELEVRTNSETHSKADIGFKKQLSPLEGLVCTRLLEERGRLVPVFNLLPERYRRFDYSYARKHLGLCLFRIKHKTEEGLRIFVANGIGAGLDVQAVKTTAEGCRLVFRLWQDIGRPVQRRVLAQDLYGSNDRWDLHALSQLYSHTRKGLRDSLVFIDSVRQDNRVCYVLLQQPSENL